MSITAMISLQIPDNFENQMFVISDTESSVSHMFKLNNCEMIDLYGQLVGIDPGSRSDDELIDLSLGGNEISFSKEVAVNMYSAVNQWFGDAIADHPIWNEDPTTFELSDEQSDALDEILAEHDAKEKELLD
jgi:hypothetical protein